MQVSFILVEPAEAGNIGAAARAMNTMGYHDLRLVRPQTDPLSETAKVFAHGSQAILEACSIYTELSEALVGIDLVCATTARHRLEKHHYLSVRTLPAFLAEKGESVHHLGLVFGSERSGLKAKDLDRCDLITTIPQSGLYPSLNLAQAVMIYSFVLSEAQTAVQIKDQRLNREVMPAAEYASLKTLCLQLMHRIGLSQRYQNYVMKGIARLAREDLYVIHNLRACIDRTLDTLEEKRNLPHD